MNPVHKMSSPKFPVMNQSDSSDAANCIDPANASIQQVFEISEVGRKAKFKTFESELIKGDLTSGDRQAACWTSIGPTSFLLGSG